MATIIKASDTDYSQRMSSRPQSETSSRFRMIGARSRRVGKNMMSPLLQQRMALRVYEDDVDVTPKPLIHPMFNPIDERQMTAFEQMGLSRAESSAQLALLSSSLYSGLRSSSSIVSRSTSYLGDELQVESLLSTQMSDLLLVDPDKAPPQFYLPRHDSNVFYTRPERVTITLKETETTIFFEMLPRTGDLRTPEGQAIKESNERYKQLTTGTKTVRKLADAETQTIGTITKSRGTYLGERKRRNRGMFVSDWVIYDTYAEPDLMLRKNSYWVVHTRESFQRMMEAQEMQDKLPRYDMSLQVARSSEQLAHIAHNTGFMSAARVMERILSNNVFIAAQKRFTGIVERNPCSLDLEFTYDLDLLWTYNCELSQDRAVSAFRWNYSNRNVMAVSYGAKVGSESKDGLLLLWCTKNPAQPARWYFFDNLISNIDWSRHRPNLLAIGFYDGSVKVLDVSSSFTNVIRQSNRETSPVYEPHWQVQWWESDEQFDFQELIYLGNQNGRVYRYPPGEDFVIMQMIKISKIEDKIPGVKRTDHCTEHCDVMISQSPGVLVLRRHPTLNEIYFVGTDEGAIYRCSTNYLYQYIESHLAHDGPIYAMEFAPFCPKLYLTCGADWYTRIWAEGLVEPLISLSTTMACVPYATWCPTYSTIIASVVNNEICIWNIRRRTYAPVSVTRSPNDARLMKVEFTANGKQLVTADVEGAVYVYNLEGMPFPPYNQEEVLVESVKKALNTKPELLRKLRKCGPPFSTSNSNDLE